MKLPEYPPGKESVSPYQPTSRYFSRLVGYDNFLEDTFWEVVWTMNMMDLPTELKPSKHERCNTFR